MAGKGEKFKLPKMVEGSLMDRMIKSTTTQHGAKPISESFLFTRKNEWSGRCKMMNLAHSGYLTRKGLDAGITFYSAESRHFKTHFILLDVATWQKHHPNGIVLFYDNEYGTSDSLWDKFADYGIDITRIIHIPFMNIEELSKDVNTKLVTQWKEGDELCIMLDSVGSSASLAELEHSIKGDGKHDLAKAKSLGVFFRLITPHLELKNIPMIASNHNYTTMDAMFSETIMKGGQNPLLACNEANFIFKKPIWEEIDGKKQIVGHTFVLFKYKTRWTKDRTEFPISVSYEEGITDNTGLADLLEKVPHERIRLVRGKNNRTFVVLYDDEGKEVQRVVKNDYLDKDTGEIVRGADFANEFWDKVFETTDWEDVVHERYALN